MTQHLIFDLDGTLIDSLPGHKAATRKAVENHGGTLSDEQFEQYNGMGMEEAAELIVKDQHLAVDPETLVREKEAAHDDIIAHLQLYPGVEACLERFKDRKLAVATSSAKAFLHDVLDRFSLTKRFDALVSRDDVSKLKPAPDIFLEAARQMDVKPETCVVVEDAPHGVHGAKEAGMAVIAVLSTGSREEFAGEAAPDAFINRLEDLKPGLVEAAASRAYRRRKGR